MKSDRQNRAGSRLVSGHPRSVAASRTREMKSDRQNRAGSRLVSGHPRSVAASRTREMKSDRQNRAGSRLVSGHPRSVAASRTRSEEHTSELQSLAYLVCRLLLEKKKSKSRETQSTPSYPVSRV